MLKNTPAMYKKAYPFLKEVDSLALANVQLHLEKAYKNFFRDPKVGFPRFKSKHHSKNSYTTNVVNGNILVEGNRIRLPKLKWISMKKHREPAENCRLKSVTVSMESSGKYFASLLYEGYSCENQAAGYGFGMLRAAKIIRHQKVIDLLYDNRKNEEYHFKSFRHSLLVVLLSIAAMVAGVILLGRMLQTQTNEAFLYLGGACLLILVGVYELHRQIPLLLHRFAKQNLRHKYKEENLFFLGQIGRRIHSAGRTMAVVAILLTISLATMFVGLTMGAGYKANMKAYYPYDAGVAIDAPLEKSSMDSIVSFTEEHCEVEDSVIYYLYAVPEKPIEALSLSDYNHLREILGLSPVVMGKNEFLVHCDTWNYMDGIRQGLKQQPELTFNGWTLTVAETPILTEPMEQYQMAGTKGYVLVLPDEAASQLVGEKIRLAMKLEDGGYPELKSDLKQFLNSGKWQPELQSGQQLPEKVTMGVTVKAWGIANSLTGFTAISFCGLYLSIIFIILSCSVLAFEQLSAIDKNQKNYAVIDRLGVPSHRQASLIRRELSTVFLIPLLFPLLLTVLLIAGAQFFFGEAILQQGLVPLYGLVTILLFCAIYLTYFGATMFLFKRVILRPEMR